MSASCLTVVSGSPGTGKTTLAALLAAAADPGIHLRSDTFYDFPARPVDPTRPESHAQNATIMRALGRAAGAFVEGGYSVFVDGVVGPWFLPVLVGELPDQIAVRYVVLRVPLELCLARIRARDEAGASARVRHMHRAFGDLGRFAAHALEAGAGTPEEILRGFRERADRGDFVVDRAALEA